MAPSASLSADVCTIQPGATFSVENYDVNVLYYKGQLTEQVWYFDVSFKLKDEGDDGWRTGLIRVGGAEAGSGLAREVAIRTALEGYQMIAPILAQERKEAWVLADQVSAPVGDLIDSEMGRAIAQTITQTATLASTSVVHIDETALDETALDEALEEVLKEDSQKNADIAQSSVEEANEIDAGILDSGLDNDETATNDDPSNDDIDHEAAAIPTDEETPVDEADSLAPQSESISLEADEPVEKPLEAVSLEQASPDRSAEDQSTDEDQSTEEYLEEEYLEEEYLEEEYLEEEYYDEKDAAADSGGEKLILLSAHPEASQTLAAWLEPSHSQDENLSVLIQLCQFFRYLHQRDWCFVHFLPQFIQLSKPIQFYDLTGAYAADDTLASGLQGAFCAPELSYEKVNIQESLSSYAIGAVLHQLTYGKPFNANDPSNTALKQIPRISQILSICLSPIPEERFPLNQLLDVLLATRQALRAGTFTWEVAHRSTVGLSTARLQNEDNYGVNQQQIGNSKAMMMGIVADGMGGLAEGDVASKTAVEALLTAPVPTGMTDDAQQAQWLEELVQKANDEIASTIREGGTTLSVVLAINKTLTLAHVGDSRIYLLRDRTLRQISEDHSYVAMLVASGEITREESLEHPERNVLTKSLGSKRQLMSGYIQNMTHWGDSISMELEDGDILLLCSDGVWDLVKDPEICEIFTAQGSIDKAVSTAIDRVLERGASDNATLLALKLNHRTNSPD